jgi:pimeloyl-ACP methyl ester carboxylesterase
MRSAHNGNADIDALITSEYGRHLTDNLQLRFLYEEDPIGKACLSFYESLGVKKEMFEPLDYYARWTLFTPLHRYGEAGKAKNYPLIFLHHGGASSIEANEFDTHLTQMVGTEHFMVAMLQDTTWQNTERVLGIIARFYPLDTERVYVVGFSQGSQAVDAALMRVPEKLTAVALCGAFIFRTYDNHEVRFTIEEMEQLTRVVVPCMQVNGECESSYYAPVNDWHPHKDWGLPTMRAYGYQDPRKNPLRDPVNINGTFARLSTPPRGCDVHQWMIGRLNMRLATLGCAPRDAETCISYLSTPGDKLHHALGFYGDREEIRMFHGYRHYTADILNRDGVDTFRYVVVENSPHGIPVMLGELVWDFFRQFRRDGDTGTIVEDEH